MQLFELGRLLITPRALAEMKRLQVDSIELLGRHQSGDWLEMDKADDIANKEAVKYGSRIFSSYTVKDVKFWVITEADRSATTILLPSEY